ncbi:cory-CC-star protein [Agrococcus sp. 1P02AA]|uniref:cory-CC-star protein n=1 Tax=Agrococcus sp. 1P02AA TaxID=3132259 RepID=UPI0039A6161D
MTPAGSAAQRRTSWSGRWAAFREGLQEYYAGPYRQMLLRERRSEDDLFMIVVLGEALGVPDPAAYYSAELLPAVWEDFHAWHRRVGIPSSPLDHVACC